MAEQQVKLLNIIDLISYATQNKVWSKPNQVLLFVQGLIDVMTDARSDDVTQVARPLLEFVRVSPERRVLGFKTLISIVINGIRKNQQRNTKDKKIRLAYWLRVYDHIINFVDGDLE